MARSVEISAFRLILSSLTFALISPITGFAGDFVRVKETAEMTKLQTAVFRYESGNSRIDLIGAVHLADKAYYDFLNRYFEQYDVLLFEMVGGEILGNNPAEPPVEEAKKDGDALVALGSIYASLENTLGLVGQAAHIDYLADNFVHADLTLAEFETLQKERGESLLSFMIQSSISAARPEKEPNSFKLLYGILRKRPDLMKLELMETMALGDEQIDAIVGENVIIDDRNAKCIEVLKKQVLAGHQTIGIFYGAGHLPGLERSILGLGYKRTFTQWLNAWRVRNL